jgi:adenosylhomocysteinase
MDRIRPNVVIDDGANFARLLVMERPALLPHLIGVAEETTSGVRAFQAMQAARELPFPVVAVNDSQLKTRFDNRHGTGETCVATTLELLGASCLAGARVAVMGYGPVGEGFARRARALGARVTVVELDPVRALEARFAGFGVARAAEALPAASMVVSATGVRHTLPLDLLRNLPNGCRVVVIGGIANEVALDQVVAAGGAILPGEKDGISQLRVPQGPTLTLLAAGDGVNYAAGPGNPIEIMDLSFAVQILAVEHLLRNRNTLPNQVLRLGPDADRRIATLALAARGIALDTAPAAGTADGSAFVPDWRVTRFSDAVTTPAAAPASPNPKELP